MKKGLRLVLLGMAIVGAFFAWEGDQKPALASAPASVPVTVDVFATGQEVADPCEMVCLLTWGPQPKGSMKVVPLPVSNNGSTATTVLMVPQGHKETIRFKESFSPNCNVEGTCPKATLGVGQESQSDATSNGTCYKNYSLNEFLVIAGGATKVLK